jgi:hypothetical protein
VHYLEFSGDDVKIIINNSTINVNSPDTKLSKNISTTTIVDKIQGLEGDINFSSINSEEKQDILSLLQKVKRIISPTSGAEANSSYVKFKEMISRKKWVFPTVTPYILKLIEILWGR